MFLRQEKVPRIAVRKMLGPPELRATSGLLLPGALGDVKRGRNLDKGAQSRCACSSLWSYSSAVYLAVVVLRHSSLQRPQPNLCFSKAA